MVFYVIYGGKKIKLTVWILRVEHSNHTNELVLAGLKRE